MSSPFAAWRDHLRAKGEGGLCVSGLMTRFGTTICIATLLVAPAWAEETDLEEGDVSVEAADESATPEGAEPEPDPEPDLVSVSFSDARMGEVARFYMARLNKPVLIDDAVGDVRISILSRDQMTEAAALELVGTALRQKGVLVGENE
ncbi:MAG: hypothetical protein AAF663_12075, partial [Planctomycetota bacterium]